VQDSGYGVISRNIPVAFWTDWGKPRKIVCQQRGIATEIPDQQYPSSDRKQHVLTRTDGTYR